MRIGNIGLSKERLIIAISVGIAFIVLVIFYVPLIRELRMCYLECKSYESQVLDAHRIIESMDKTRRGTILLTEKNVSGAVDKFIKHASSIGITVLSISPKETVEQRELQFKILPIEMEIRSTVQQFATFIGSLAELRQGLIKVKSFDLSPDAEDRAKVRANLALDMYLTDAE